MVEIPTFKSVEQYPNHSRGLVIEVGCDKERDRNNTGLVGVPVIIDKKNYLCLGVEIMPKGGRIREGEIIGLLVRECSPPA